ncbi:MAG: hypothetical protein ABSA46_12815 [Thermodesulfovibrionales bacterium]
MADIINVIIEELVRQRSELPGFSTLVRAARHARHRINSRYFKSLSEHLLPEEAREFDVLLIVSSDDSGWNRLKRDPKKPTNNEVRGYLEHVQWLKSWAQRLPSIDYIPVAKYHQNVLEARALDASDLKDLQPHKRYALMIILVHSQLRSCRRYRKVTQLRYVPGPFIYSFYCLFLFFSDIFTLYFISSFEEVI